MAEAKCRIPVRATMQRINGQMMMVSAEWAEISADAIARYLLEHFNIETENTANLCGR